MAIVRGPAYSMQARGSVGPTTFCSGSTNNMVRSRINPVQPKSPNQTNHQCMVLEQCSYLYANESDTHLQYWIDFAKTYQHPDRFGQPRFFPARYWYFKYGINKLKYYIPGYIIPPPRPGCDFLPNFTCQWTEDGIQLSWDLAIPTDNRIVVYQNRNLNASILRPRKGKLSHVLTESDSSPQLLSNGIAETGIPTGFPSILGNSWIHVHIFTVDNYGRKSVQLFYRLNATE